jgi:O-antigen/teichoic acid export membrane protein
MGIIRRQSLQNLILSYGGTLLGYINKAFLFTQFLTTSQYGLIEWLITLSVTIAELSKLGVSTIIVKFYPYFNSTQKQQDFYNVIWTLPVVGFLFFAVLFFIFRIPFLELYREDSPEVLQWYFLLIPMVALQIYTEVVDALLRARLKSVMSQFSREVFVRILQTALVAFFAGGWISITQFYILFVASYGLQLALMTAYLLFLGKIRWGFSFFSFRKRIGRIMLNYGLYSLFSVGATLVLVRLDFFMISVMINIDAAGMYALAFNLGAVVYLPLKAVTSIGYAVVTKSMRNKDYANVHNIYRKSCSTGLVLGGFIWIILWVNADNLFFYIDKDFQSAKIIMILIGLHKLIDSASGINGGIILASRFFRFELFSSLILLVMAFFLNLVLIPLWGMTGAALAAILSVFVYNLARIIFLWMKFKMQPYNLQTLLALALLGATVALGLLLPVLETGWIDGLYRSVVITLFFGSAAYFLKLIPDANELLHSLLKRGSK